MSNQRNYDIHVSEESVGQGMGTGVRLTREYIWRHQDRPAVRALLGSWEAQRGDINLPVLLAARVLLDTRYAVADNEHTAHVVPAGEFSRGQDGHGIALGWHYFGVLDSRAFSAETVALAERYIAPQAWPAAVVAHVWREQWVDVATGAHGRIALGRSGQPLETHQFVCYDSTPLIALQIAPVRWRLSHLIDDLNRETRALVDQARTSEQHAQERLQRQRAKLAAR